MLIMDEYFWQDGIFTPLILTDVLLIIVIMAAIIYLYTKSKKKH